MEKPEGESFATLFNALVKSLQTLCHGHLEFNNGIEIIGHINLSVDKNSSMHYILEEKVCKNEENSTLFISKSFHAQHQKPDPKTRNDSENSRDGNATVDRSIDDEESTAISSISSALTKHEKSRLGSTLHSKEYDNLHSKSKTITNTAKRKASSDYSNDTRTAKSSHFSSSPSPVSHFLSSHSPHAASNPSSPVDTKPSIRQLQCEDMAGTVLPQTATVSGDNAGDLGVNLAGSVLERVDDHSNSDLPDRGDDSDGDLEVTFIKEEYVEGEQSACQFETSGGHHYGRGTHQRASSSDMHDASMYPVSLHHSASSTFVPSHDMTAAHHYGPSTSSQPQPGTSGVRGVLGWTPGLQGYGMMGVARSTDSVAIKTYTCPICKYSTTYLTNYKRHMRRHTGQLFRCGVCGLQYNCRYYLQKHILRNHGSLHHNAMEPGSSSVVGGGRSRNVAMEGSETEHHGSLNKYNINSDLDTTCETSKTDGHGYLPSGSADDIV